MNPLPGNTVAQRDFNEAVQNWRNLDEDRRVDLTELLRCTAHVFRAAAQLRNDPELTFCDQMVLFHVERTFDVVHGILLCRNHGALAQELKTIHTKAARTHWRLSRSSKGSANSEAEWSVSMRYSELASLCALAAQELPPDHKEKKAIATRGRPKASVRHRGLQRRKHLNAVVPSAGTVGVPPSHSDDFTSVNWFGTKYSFSKGAQALAVKALWEAWEKGGHSLTQETIAERVESSSTRFELAKVFRHRNRSRRGYVPHPAWGTMITSDRRGIYRLTPAGTA